MPEAEVFRRYRLFIFDADDTLRQTEVPGKPCPHGPGEWILLPGVREVLGEIPWHTSGGPWLGIASNQDQVAYGHLSLETARELLRELARSAANVIPEDEALQLCPHALDLPCRCRKPEPGMLLAIMRFYRIQPRDTLFVGNHDTDREAADRAGIDFRWAGEFFAQAQ